jgi:hypothetical protein
MEEQKVVPLRGDEACNKMRQHEQWKITTNKMWKLPIV